MAQILVVDDERSIRTTMKALLELEGHEVEVADSGAQALSTVERFVPDVAILDVVMPGMDGLKLLSALRARCPGVRCIVITGAPEASGAAAAMSAGAVDYLEKPVSREGLCRAVADVCASADVWATMQEASSGDPRSVADLSLQGQIEVERLRETWRGSEVFRRHEAVIRALVDSVGASSQLDLVFRAIGQHVSQVMDVAMFIVSFYDEALQLIRARYALNEGQEMDVAALPAIPLAEEGRGRQSQVIHTGEPLIVRDKSATQHLSDTEYSVSSDGNVREGVASSGDDVARSAIFVPMMRDGCVRGVLQVQSYRPDAYTDQDVDLLVSMAAIASAATSRRRWGGQV